MKKLLIGSLALGSLAVMSVANFSEEPTQLCTLISPNFPEKVKTDCSKIYAGEQDYVKGIYDGRYADYEWSCLRIRNEEDERKARASIEKMYFPPAGYQLETYLFPQRVFCSVEGIHQK